MLNMFMHHRLNMRSQNGFVQLYTTRGLLVPFTAVSLI
jgi:hypothetical protein